MNGFLRLRVALVGGHSTLVESRCEFPLQVLRPRPTAGGLEVTVLTPSGGLLDGDELQAEIVVEEGASLQLRTQAATQVHRGRSSQAWSVLVDEGATFSYLPHALVPHEGARHACRAAVAMARGGRAFIAEAVAPGRAHRGELFAYDELRLDLDVWRAGALVASERQLIRPACPGACRPLGPFPYFGAAYIFPGLNEGLSLAPRDGLLSGSCELAFGGTLVRILAERAYDVELALAETLRHGIACRPPATPKANARHQADSRPAAA